MCCRGTLPSWHPYRLVNFGIGAARTSPTLLCLSGLPEVLPDSVTILADVAEPAETIDIHRAESARERARSRLDLPEPNLDFGRARVALRKSLVRLEVAKLAKSKA